MPRVGESSREPSSHKEHRLTVRIESQSRSKEPTCVGADIGESSTTHVEFKTRGYMVWDRKNRISKHIADDL